MARSRVTFQVTASTGGLVPLFHGTDLNSALWMREFGYNREKALELGGDGAFWLAPVFEHAAFFAQVNPAGGDPCVLKIGMPEELLNDWLQQSPPLVQRREERGFVSFEFIEECGESLTQCLTKATIANITASGDATSIRWEV